MAVASQATMREESSRIFSASRLYHTRPKIMTILKFRSTVLDFRIFVVFGGAAYSGCAHETNVHQRISERAVRRSDGLNEFLTEIFGQSSTTVLRARTSIDWIDELSWREDDNKQDEALAASLDHFYHPRSRIGRLQGLTNHLS